MPCDSLWVLIACFCFCSQSLPGRVRPLCLLCGQPEVHIYQAGYPKTAFLLVVWGIGVSWDPSVTPRTWGERLAWLFLFISMVSQSTHEEAARHRLPGSALTVTPWLSHLVSPVNEVIIYIMWEYGACSPISSLTDKWCSKLNHQSFPFAT